jgi:hypothetical protein
MIISVSAEEELAVSRKSFAAENFKSRRLEKELEALEMKFAAVMG